MHDGSDDPDAARGGFRGTDRFMPGGRAMPRARRLRAPVP